MRERLRDFDKTGAQVLVIDPHESYRVLGMKTVGQIRAYLTRHLRRLCPKLEMLDTKR